MSSRDSHSWSENIRRRLVDLLTQHLSTKKWLLIVGFSYNRAEQRTIACRKSSVASFLPTLSQITEPEFLFILVWSWLGLAEGPWPAGTGLSWPPLWVPSVRDGRSTAWSPPGTLCDLWPRGLFLGSNFHTLSVRNLSCHWTTFWSSINNGF